MSVSQVMAELQRRGEARAEVDAQVGEIMNVFYRLAGVRDEIAVLDKDPAHGYEAVVTRREVKVTVTVLAIDVRERLLVIEAGHEKRLRELVATLMAYVDEK